VIQYTTETSKHFLPLHNKTLPLTSQGLLDQNYLLFTILLFTIFAEPLGTRTSYREELCGFIRAIEIAKQMNWNNIWVETDSTLVVMAAKESNQVPWELRNNRRM